MIDHVHLHAGAYALDALPLDERALFERHLASCDICRVEVAGYREAAARLGIAAATRAPTGLREEILAAAGSTRQLAPGGGRIRAGDRLRPYLAPVAAALVAVVLGLSGTAAHLSSENSELRAQLGVAQTERELAQLLPEARQVPLDAPAGVRASFVLSQEDDRAMLVVRGLGELDADQAYQLWLVHDGTPVPDAVFTASGADRMVVAAEGRIDGAELVAITVEPAGGVSTPTGAPILSGQL